MEQKPALHQKEALRNQVLWRQLLNWQSNLTLTIEGSEDQRSHNANKSNH